MTTSFEDELELMNHLRRLWIGRWLLLAALLLGAVAGVVVQILLPREYQATATLQVTDPQLSAQPARVAVAEIMPIFRTRRIAAQIIDEFDLDAPPRELTVAGFRELLEVSEVANSFIDVRLVLDDPDLVVDVVNRLAELGVRLHNNLMLGEVAQNTEFLEPRLDAARQRLEDLGVETGSAPSQPRGGPAAGDDSAAGLAPALGELVDLYRRQVAPSEAELMQSVAREAYAELLRLSDQKEIRAASRRARLELIDPAVPDLRLRDSIVWGLGLGATLGFLLCAVWLLARGFAQAARELDSTAT